MILNDAIAQFGGGDTLRSRGLLDLYQRQLTLERERLRLYVEGVEIMNEPVTVSPCVDSQVRAHLLQRHAVKRAVIRQETRLRVDRVSDLRVLVYALERLNDQPISDPELHAILGW